jgi:hypothetical protein
VPSRRDAVEPFGDLSREGDASSGHVGSGPNCNQTTFSTDGQPMRNPAKLLISSLLMPCFYAIPEPRPL